MEQTKVIKLLQLTLENFKGEQLRVSEFDGGVTTISGRNGLGKSRHLAGFLWLITGKDQFDRDNYEIKTRVDGNELHNVVASVEGVFDVSGERVTLKRALVENWVKPRGCTESEFKGNKTECWYDGTPVSVNEYNKRVTALFGDPTLFKLLTNPEFFPSLPWQKQREQLMALAGEIDNAEIAGGNPDFTALLDRIGGKSFEDYKKTIASRKRQIKEELAQIQPRIDQTARMKPAELDWAGLEKSINDVEEEIAELSKKIADCGEVSTARAEIRAEINRLKAERNQIVREAELEERRKADEAIAGARAAYLDREDERREAQKRIDNQERTINNLLSNVSRIEIEIESKDRKLEALNGERETLRGRWHEINNEKFVAAANCPTCGQPMPEEKINSALEAFEKSKQDRIGHVNKRGLAIKAEIEQATAEKNASKEKLATLYEEISSQGDVLDSFKARLVAIPSLTYTSPAPVAIVAESIPEVSKIDAIIKERQIALGESPENLEVGYRTELSARTRTLQDLQRKLVTRDTIVKLNEEIERLQGDGKRLSGDLADVEREEFLLSEFTKAKCDRVEKRVNRMFRNVRFQLFDKTLDGNVFETCRILVDGVLYPSANTASQINAGLDILGVLSGFYKESLPVFVDGAERANALDLPPTQCILLRVTDDNVLTITNGHPIY